MAETKGPAMPSGAPFDRVDDDGDPGAGRNGDRDTAVDDESHPDDARPPDPPASEHAPATEDPPEREDEDAHRRPPRPFGDLATFLGS